MNEESTEPMTETVFVPREMEFQNHNWSQQGYSIECDGQCHLGMKHGSNIPSGQMLSGKKGDWKLVSE